MSEKKYASILGVSEISIHKLQWPIDLNALNEPNQLKDPNEQNKPNLSHSRDRI